LTYYADVDTGFLFTGFRIEIPGIYFQDQKYSNDNNQTMIELME
jgi:hypothetical protein